MRFEETIEKILKELCEAWNQRDFSMIEAHLTDKVTVRSPNILLVNPSAKGPEMTGKKEVINYWNALLEINKFDIELIEIKEKSRQSVSICQFTKVNVKVELKIHLNQFGKVEFMQVTNL